MKNKIINAIEHNGITLQTIEEYHVYHLPIWRCSFCNKLNFIGTKCTIYKTSTYIGDYFDGDDYTHEIYKLCESCKMEELL